MKETANIIEGTFGFQGGKTLRVLSLIYLMMVAQWAGAQDFKTLMSGFREKYKENKNLHVTMIILVYENASAQTPFYSEHADIMREGLNYRYRMGSNELLMNNRYTIMVDKGSRQISCSNRDLRSEAAFSSSFQFNIDSIFNVMGQPQLVSRSGDVALYRQILKESAVKQIDLSVDVQNGYVKRIEYRYNDDQWASIDINLFDPDPVFDATTFSEVNYVLLENGRFKAATAFSGYDVLRVESNQ